MASRRRRLGTLLTIRDDLVAVLRVLDATPAPRGHELAAAQALRAFCADRWPAIEWQVQPVGAGGANLVASHGDGALLYSHLDTSLDDGPGMLRVRDGVVEGFGLAVARGPVAAALLAFAGATRGTLLLASSGTHRRGRDAAGVLTWLAANPRPPAAVVAKSGPPGVLWSEPGALYLSVEVRGRAGAVMSPASAAPPGGLPARVGRVVDAVSAWCTDYVASHLGVGQLDAAAGIGAITSGLPDKADLFPASAEVGVYVVTLPGAVAAELAASLEASVPVPDGCSIIVTADPVHDAATTASDAPIVQAAIAAWTREFGAPADITDWTGSTDGVVFRAHDIDTVRLGPQPAGSDVLRLDQLEGFVRVYRDLLDHCLP